MGSLPPPGGHRDPVGHATGLPPRAHPPRPVPPADDLLSLDSERVYPSNSTPGSSGGSPAAVVATPDGNGGQHQAPGTVAQVPRPTSVDIEPVGVISDTPDMGGRKDDDITPVPLVDGPAHDAGRPISMSGNRPSAPPMADLSDRAYPVHHGAQVEIVSADFAGTVTRFSSQPSSTVDQEGGVRCFVFFFCLTGLD